MTFNKLFGIYFNETVTNETQYDDKEFTPCFIVKTTSAIDKLDDVLTFYDSVTEFRTDVANKGLAKTTEFIKKTLTEAENNNFYIYSLKTDTAAGIAAAIAATETREDIRDIFYYEENNTNGLTLAQKIAAFKTAVESAETRGNFKYIFIDPYKTIDDAIEAAENTTAEAASIAAYQSLLNTDGSGRILIINPDNDGNIAGKCADRAFFEEVAATEFNTSVEELKFNFTPDQMLVLQNLGVLFIRATSVQGIIRYKIHGGLTTSFKNEAADGLLKRRTICDELLKRVKWEIEPYLMESDSDATVKFIQTNINAIIDEFNGDYTDAKGTSLKATKGENYIINVNGTIQPIGSTLFINVNTTFN